MSMGLSVVRTRNASAASKVSDSLAGAQTWCWALDSERHFPAATGGAVAAEAAGPTSHGTSAGPPRGERRVLLHSSRVRLGAVLGRPPNGNLRRVVPAAPN